MDVVSHQTLQLGPIVPAGRADKQTEVGMVGRGSVRFQRRVTTSNPGEPRLARCPMSISGAAMLVLVLEIVFPSMPRVRAAAGRSPGRLPLQRRPGQHQPGFSSTSTSTNRSRSTFRRPFGLLGEMASVASRSDFKQKVTKDTKKDVQCNFRERNPRLRGFLSYAASPHPTSRELHRDRTDFIPLRASRPSVSKSISTRWERNHERREKIEKTGNRFLQPESRFFPGASSNGVVLITFHSEMKVANPLSICCRTR
jgi:hypothetical protein